MSKIYYQCPAERSSGQGIGGIRHLATRNTIFPINSRFAMCPLRNDGPRRDTSTRNVVHLLVRHAADCSELMDGFGDGTNGEVDFFFGVKPAEAEAEARQREVFADRWLAARGSVRDWRRCRHCR